MTSEEFSSYCFFFRIPAQGLYTGPGYFRNWPVARSWLANFMLFMMFYGGQGRNRTADTGIFRPEWRFLASLFSTTYAHRPRAKLPQTDRSGHEMTGVGHDLVTLRLHHFETDHSDHRLR